MASISFTYIIHLILTLTVRYRTETIAPIWQMRTLKHRGTGQGDDSHLDRTANHTQKNLAFILEHLQRSSPKFSQSTPTLLLTPPSPGGLSIPGTGGAGPTDTSDCL